MYKLTYESEDDLDNTKNEDQKPQFDSEYKKPEKMDAENNYDHERSDTVKSVVASSYAAKEYEANQQTQNKKKFYQFFRDDANSLKKQKCFVSKGVKEIGLIASVVAIFCCVIALFVLLHGSKTENKMLKERLSVIEVMVTGGSFMLQAPPLPDIPEAFDVPKPVDDVEVEYDRSIDEVKELKEKFNNVHAAVRSRINNLDMKVGDLDMRLTDSERKVAQEFRELKQKIESANGIATLSLDVSSEEESKMEGGIKAKSVVFSAAHVPMTSENLDTSSETYEIAPTPSLTYDFKNVDLNANFMPENGEFVVPLDGTYVFQISFCSRESVFGGSATVALIKDNTVLKSFNPSMTIGDKPKDNFSLFQDAFGTVSRNSFSVVSSLKSGDRVSVSVLAGSIVELNISDAVNACTSFAGYRV